jgi:hypothetical protein
MEDIKEKPTQSRSSLDDSPCSVASWRPEEGAKYDLVEIREGHCFAWRKAEGQGSQYLCCVICRKPHHQIFSQNAESSHRLAEPPNTVES